MPGEIHYFGMDPSPSTDNDAPATPPSSPPLTSPTAMPVPVKSQARAGKRTPVPLILEAFPTPPTYIPHSPRDPLLGIGGFPSTPGLGFLLSSPVGAYFNPPPSLPPNAPLPPLPGPSPISDHESILIMSSNRSRRSSKVSTMSAESSTQSIRSVPSSYVSNRDSTDTHMSSASGGANSLVSPPTTANTFGRRGSVASARSLHSHSPSGSLSSQSPGCPRPPFTEKPSTIGYAISEEDSADLSHVDKESRIRVSSISDKENARSVPQRRELRRAHTEDTIPSIDTQGAALNNGAEPGAQAQNSRVRMSASRPRSGSHKYNKSPGVGSGLSGLAAFPATPRMPERRSPVEEKRSVSPDIVTMISKTPRPRTRSSSHFSNGSSRSGSHTCSMRRYASENLKSGDGSSMFSRSPSESNGGGADSPMELAYIQDEGVSECWNDDSFVSDYGTPIDRYGHFVEMDPELEARLDGTGSDSDSSIDLHTPLPHLMLRHGLLSPHSKILPESDRSPSPQPSLPDDRPGSMLSVVSNTSMMTKSGLFKDQRDTPQRRVRHRDGRQLRAGMGLTTGLGWSDSEDEDAPSPLTRRLSTLNLANRSSSSSLRSSVHPLSRSQSHSTLYEEDYYDKDVITPRRPILRTRPPPTSWQKRSGNGGGRTSTSSVGSAFSLTLSIPEDEDEDTRSTGVRRTPSESSTRQGGVSSARDAADTPSTASTISLPMPVTPDDAPAHPKLDKEKVLPPLPPAIRKYPSNLALRPPAASNIISRPRAFSNASSTSSSGAVAGHIPSNPSTSVKSPPSASYTPRAVTSPRPLQLSLSTRPQPGEVHQRSGQVLTYNRHLHDQQRMRATSGPPRPIASGNSTAPTTPTTPGFSKPMPRTGTGMVYRTSSNPGRAAPSRMRMPGAISQSLNVPSASARTTAAPRSIAL